jgi:hypothetical protein
MCVCVCVRACVCACIPACVYMCEDWQKSVHIMSHTQSTHLPICIWCVLVLCADTADPARTTHTHTRYTSPSLYLMCADTAVLIMLCVNNADPAKTTHTQYTPPLCIWCVLILLCCKKQYTQCTPPRLYLLLCRHCLLCAPDGIVYWHGVYGTMLCFIDYISTHVNSFYTSQASKVPNTTRAFEGFRCCEKWDVVRCETLWDVRA